jgi:PhoPQ-activated pathogenicity-related protein
MRLFKLSSTSWHKDRVPCKALWQRTVDRVVPDCDCASVLLMSSSSAAARTGTALSGMSAHKALAAISRTWCDIYMQVSEVILLPWLRCHLLFITYRVAKEGR